MILRLIHRIKHAIRLWRDPALNYSLRGAWRWSAYR